MFDRICLYTGALSSVEIPLLIAILIWQYSEQQLCEYLNWFNSQSLISASPECTRMSVSQVQTPLQNAQRGENKRTEDITKSRSTIIYENLQQISGNFLSDIKMFSGRKLEKERHGNYVVRVSSTFDLELNIGLSYVELRPRPLQRRKPENYAASWLQPNIGRRADRKHVFPLRSR